MKAFRTAVDIASTPAKVWSILTDAAAWPSWNATVTKVEGAIAPGAKVTVHVKVAPGNAFPVKVAEFEPERRMVWRGGMPLPFLFKGERTYTLTPQGDGAVRFEMAEVYTGWFAPMITRSIPDLQPAFDEFAACLKRRAEQG